MQQMHKYLDFHSGLDHGIGIEVFIPINKPTR